MAMLVGTVAYDRLIGGVGTDCLGEAILAAASASVEADEIFAYWVRPGGAPTPIASSGRPGSSVVRAAMYSTRFYRLDPLAELAEITAQGGPTRCGRMVATEVADASYRRECYDRPDLFEKRSFVRQRAARNFVLSVYRRQGRRPMRDDAFLDLANLILPVIAKQAELLTCDLEAPLSERVERRLEQAFPLLTRRELEVCARTIVGMTAEGISIDLRIAHTTVLTYRRRAYARYGVSSAHELMGRLLA